MPSPGRIAVSEPTDEERAVIAALNLLAPFQHNCNYSRYQIETTQGKDFDLIVVSGAARQMMERILREVDRQKDQALQHSVMMPPVGGFQA